MRTIKFRVWDKHKKYMHKLDALFLDEKMFRVQNYKNEHDVFSFGTEYFSEPMQFTGLLDKNGVEVYEGDILPLNIHYTKGNFVVSWDEENALFRACLCGSGHCWKLETLNFKHIEVIGNIYEHPHLPEENHD